MIAVSLAANNHVATATLTAVSALAAYPVANLALPSRPFRPYMSASAGAGQMITVDHGTAKTVGVVGLNRTNFITATFLADDSSAFNSAGGSPQYSATITCAESMDTRYHGSHRPATTVTRRWNRIVIANQATVATEPVSAHPAGASHYLIGALWIGTLSTVPRDILMDPEFDRPEPAEDLVLPSGSRSRSILGYPYITLACRRLAQQDAGGLDTEWRQWLALDEQWRRSDYALVLPRALVPSDAYIMRRVKGFSGTWGKVWSDGDLMLEEVVSG